jgi:chaperone BCS1
VQSCVTSLPKNSILLLEDIDCAFPSQDEEEKEDDHPFFGFRMRKGKREGVTMSGLLNVLDGVGSEDGMIVFATVSGT